MFSLIWYSPHTSAPLYSIARLSLQSHTSLLPLFVVVICVLFILSLILCFYIVFLINILILGLSVYAQMFLLHILSIMPYYHAILYKYLSIYTILTPLEQ